MKQVVDFKCSGDKLDEIPKDIGSEFSFPEVHTKAEYLADLSIRLKNYKGDNLCRLPFCNTVEAEALGGSIKLGDSKTGPRVERYTINSIEELNGLKGIEFTRGRISEVLRAIELLKAKDEIVVLNVEGPFTIITSLIDSRIFYKAMRKNPEIVQKALKSIENSVVEYIKEGINRGAKVISLGDPSGTMDIVGPKIYREFSGKATYNILKRVEGELNGGIIHICGKTSTAFQSMGVIEAYPIKFEESISYGQAIEKILKNRSEVNIIGHNCIKRTSLELKNSTLWVIKIK